MKLKIGDVLPNFLSKDTNGNDFDSRNFIGKQPVVIYFYPKNDTPGCTSETLDFISHHDEFIKVNTVIIGVSRDTLVSHQAFRTKLNIPFNLISDTQEELCFAFDVMRNKMMYGKQVRGLERSTFVFDKMGDLVREWRGVKVDGHAAEVLNFIRIL